MLSISDITEEMQIEYPEIDIFDVDTYNGVPALTHFSPNVSLFAYIDDAKIYVAVEDDATGKDYTTVVAQEETISDFYQELTSFIQWCLNEKIIVSDKTHYRKLLQELSEYGLEPDLSYIPN